MYKILKNLDGQITIHYLTNNVFIPLDEANTDYQAYLRWCEEGNTPTPADEVTL